jgi:Cu(I)/Ag(I) efflux system membrane fusion protein
LVIPVTAALVTGTRAIVYVELPERDKPTYEGREIVLGPRAGSYYIVRSGLKEGERVVTKGNFKIDSALQIQAKPSMMTPEGGASPPEADLSAISRNQLNAVLTTSETVANAFKAGDLDEVHLGFAELEKAIKEVDMKLLQGHSHMLWMEVSMLLRNDVVEGKEVKTLREAERIVESLKINIASLQAKFGLSQTARPKVIKAVNPEFRKQLEKVFSGYFVMQESLAKDQFDEAIAGVSKIKEALAGVDMKLLSGTQHDVWMKHAAALKKILSDASKAGDIELLRQAFVMLSEQMFVVGRQFGPPGKSALYQLKCPMAFNNRGATWLQQDKDTRNPYFGSAMLKCGDVIEVIEPANDRNIGGHQHD